MEEFHARPPIQWVAFTLGGGWVILTGSNGSREAALCMTVQEHVKRALEVAAGGHNVLMSGAPDAGKTLSLVCMV